MMKLGTRGRYAVLALCDLATRDGDTPLPLARLAARIGISASYLEQLFAGLRRAGLVHSVRGPGGGYRLSRNGDAIIVADIVRAVELDNDDEFPKDDPTGALWRELERRAYLYLEQVSLRDVIAGRLARDGAGDEHLHATEAAD